MTGLRAERPVAPSAASVGEDARSLVGAVASDVIHCFALIALVTLLVLYLLPAVLGAARGQAVIGA